MMDRKHAFAAGGGIIVAICLVQVILNAMEESSSNCDVAAASLLESNRLLAANGGGGGGGVGATDGIGTDALQNHQHHQHHQQAQGIGQMPAMFCYNCTAMLMAAMEDETTEFVRARLEQLIQNVSAAESEMNSNNRHYQQQQQQEQEQQEKQQQEQQQQQIQEIEKHNNNNNNDNNSNNNGENGGNNGNGSNGNGSGSSGGVTSSDGSSSSSSDRNKITHTIITTTTKQQQQQPTELIEVQKYPPAGTLSWDVVDDADDAKNNNDNNNNNNNNKNNNRMYIFEKGGHPLPWSAQHEVLCTERMPVPTEPLPSASIILVWNTKRTRSELELTVLSSEIASQRASTPHDPIIAVYGRSREDAAALCNRDLYATVLWFPNHHLAVNDAIARQTALQYAQGNLVVFGAAGDYYTPGWLHHGTPGGLGEKSHDVNKFDNCGVLFWNYADSATAYTMQSFPVVTPGFITCSLPASCRIVAGGFALRRKNLMEAGGYPLSPHLDEEEALTAMIKSVSPDSLSDIEAAYDNNGDASFVFWSNQALPSLSGNTMRPSEPNFRRSDRNFLSVVLATGGDRVKLLRVMLLSMELQTMPPAQVLVMLGGDDYGQGEMVRKFFSDEESISFHNAPKDNYGHGAREAGVRLTQGEWVLITNDDNYYAPIYIQTLRTVVRVRQGRECPPSAYFYPMVHDYEMYFNYRAKQSVWGFGEVDMGAVIAEGGVSRGVGFPFRARDADWDYFKAVKQQSNGCVEGVAMDQILFVHN